MLQSLAKDARNTKSHAAAILLAAGESSRMGHPKALLKWTDGVPLIRYQLTALTHAGYESIIVVLGHDSQRISRVIPKSVRTHAIVNERYKLGRSTSIVLGLGEMHRRQVGALLIMSVDQPRKASTLEALRLAWEDSRPSIVIPSYKGHGGHPPLFDSSLFSELMQIDESTYGLRQVMLNHQKERLFVEVDDPLTLTNLNTRQDYENGLELALKQRGDS